MAAGRNRHSTRPANRRRHRRRKPNRGRTPFALAVIILVVIALAVVGIVLMTKYHKYTDYTVNSVLAMSNSEENTKFYPYGNGYIKCASDGLTYFNSDRIVWGENYSMAQPIIDICGDYIVVADATQRSVNMYDRSGFVNRINLSRSVMDLEVTKAGVMALATSDGNVSYIEIRDKNGDEIMTSKNIFSVSGYLMDLAISDDGSRLAAVYVSVDKGTMKSKVVFYDLSGDGSNPEIVAGTFDQYESMLLTTVRYMGDGTFCVVGDSLLTFFNFEEAPEIIWEKTEGLGEIQTLMFGENCVGMVSEEAETETAYVIKIYDTSGNTVLEKGVDFSFARASFAGENVMMYAGNECLMYSFQGVEKFHQALDDHIEGLVSTNGRDFVYGTNNDTRFITLK